MPVEQQLLDLLPMRRGHFRYESGHHGDVWLELDQLFVRPTALRPVVDELATRLSAYKVDAVCGPMIGGALVAQMVAAKLDIECYFTQREASLDDNGEAPRYRLPSVFRQLANGKSVAVVDDAINAGSAVLGSMAELAAAGAKVSVVGTFVALGAAANAFPVGCELRLVSILSIPSRLWPAGECPLCSAGVPLNDGA